MYTKTDIIMSMLLLTALLIVTIVELKRNDNLSSVKQEQPDYAWHGQTPNLVYGEIE